MRQARSPFGEASMRGSFLVLAATVGLSMTMIAGATTEENAQDFMQLHKVEIAFHEAGTTKNLDLMLSLFADDAVLTAGGKTYTGKDQIRRFWQGAGTLPAANPLGCLHAGFPHSLQCRRRSRAPLFRMPLRRQASQQARRAYQLG